MECEFEIVDRPTGSRYVGRGRELSRLSAAIIETASTGQAIRLLRNGRSQQSFSAGNVKTLKNRGLRGRTRKDGDYLYLWAERIEPI